MVWCGGVVVVVVVVGERTGIGWLVRNFIILQWELRYCVV